jgi:hypothetical protein
MWKMTLIGLALLTAAILTLRFSWWLDTRTEEELKKMGVKK